MADNTNKFEVNLIQSLNTDTIQQDFKTFLDTSVPLNENTGIERDGGITNVYKTTHTYTTEAQRIITDDGKIISVEDSATTGFKNVKIDDQTVGQVSSYGVEKNITISDSDDVFITSTSYVTCTITDNIIKVSEYDYNQTLLNTRNIVYTNLLSVMSSFTSISFVRWNGIKYSDSLEFALRLGDQVVILKETDPNISITTAFQSTSVLGNADIKCAVSYNNTIVFAGGSGRIGSFDGINWKNYDGSGSGSGIYNNGDASSGVIGSSTINTMTIFKGNLVVAGDGGRVGCYDGSSWLNWNSGKNLTNNATVVSTDNILCSAVYDDSIAFGGSTGKIGSWNSITNSWVLYSAGAGLSDLATLTGSVSANAMLTMIDCMGMPTLVVAGASGRLGSMKTIPGTAYSTGGTALGMSAFTCVTYGAGKFVGLNGSTAAYSSDGGNTWITTAAPNASWLSIAYGNGVFVATSTTNITAYSTDGITWIQGFMPASYNWRLTYGAGLFVAVAYGSAVGAYSIDGITWTKSSMPSSANWKGIAYSVSSNIFVTAAYGSTSAASSSDGLNWTARTMPSSANWQSISANSIRFTAITYGATTSAYSNDGITWTAASALPSASNWIQTIYANGFQIAIAQGSTAAAYSTDGTTWTSVTLPSSSSWIDMAYGAGRVVVVSSSTNATLFSYNTFRVLQAYNATGGATFPINNATAIGANPIYTLAQYNEQLIVAGGTSTSLVGSWGIYNNTWNVYSASSIPLAGTTIYNDNCFIKIAQNCRNVAYGNGIFVAIAYGSSAVATSPDGITWTARTMPSSALWQAITYGNGIFVAISNGSAVAATSPDGITWTQITMPSSSAWRSVTYGNGLFVTVVAGAGSTVAATSPDGITWTQRTLPSANWQSVTFGNGIFVAVSNGSIAATSPDGITWTARTMPSSSAWLSVSYGNGLFVTVANGSAVAATSPDGITWTQRTMPSSSAWYSVTYGNGIFVAISNGSAVAATSPDGITWTARTMPSSSAWYSITYGNGIFVTVVTLPTLNIAATSPDGITWTQADIGYKQLVSNTYIYNFNGIYFSLTSEGNTSQIKRSTDGINWIAVDMQVYAGWNSMIYGNGKYIVFSNTSVSSERIIAYSTDGIIWTTATAPNASWQSVTFGNGIFVAVVNNSSIAYTSSDGITWTQRTLPVSSTWQFVAYGNGLFVAIANSTTIAATSPDGITWTQRTLPVSANWYGITYGNGVFVAVALGSAIAVSSSDGITWTQRTLPSSSSWRFITYSNGNFIAVASNSNTATYSPDGITWTTLTLKSNTFTTILSSTFNGIIYLGNAYKGKFQAIYPTITDNATMLSRPVYTSDVYNNSLIIGGFLGGVASWDNITGKNIYTSGNGISGNSKYIGQNAVYSMQDFQGNLYISGASSTTNSVSSTGSYVPFYTEDIYIRGNLLTGYNTLNYLYAYRYENGQYLINLVGNAQGESFIVDNTTKSIQTINCQYALPQVSNGLSRHIISTSVKNDLYDTIALRGFGLVGYTDFTNFNTEKVATIKLTINSGCTVNGNLTISLAGQTGVVVAVTTTQNTAALVASTIAAATFPGWKVSASSNVVTFVANTIAGYAIGTNTFSVASTGVTGTIVNNTYTTAVYPEASYTVGNSNVMSAAAGFGYEDFTYQLASSSTNIFNYAPQFTNPVNGLYQIWQSNSNTLTNAYGKLTNNYQVASTKPFEFRTNYIGGVQSYISAALLDSYTTDTVGTVLTTVGEFSDAYQPMIIDDDKILYMYNNNMHIIKISQNISNRLQRISSNAYKINTLSPLNIIDIDTNTLESGSLDYNGRSKYFSNAVPSASQKVASLVQGKYANSVDVGDKLVTITGISSANMELIGYRIPQTSQKYMIDTYISDIYAFSTLNNGSELVVSDKVDTVYASTANVPLPLGITYADNNTAYTSTSTLFLVPNYDGYSLGNDITGRWDVFNLFGQYYIFDEKNIYAADINTVTGIYSSKTLLCGALGLRYIATTPTEADFYSDFDNSIYTFTGGRNLTKFKRMNRLPKINSGIYNVRDNTLALDTDDSIIWVRDSIITNNYKTPNMAGVKYYNTSDGIILGSDTANFRYTYYKYDVTSVPEPLAVQTAYFGFNLNEKSILSAWVATIMCETKEKITVTGTSYVIDEDKSREQKVVWTINPADYTAEGYTRLRIQPENQRSLGTSLKLECDSKILLVSVIPEFIKAETAVTTAARSR